MVALVNAVRLYSAGAWQGYGWMMSNFDNMLASLPMFFWMYDYVVLVDHEYDLYVLGWSLIDSRELQI